MMAIPKTWPPLYVKTATGSINYWQIFPVGLRFRPAKDMD